MSNDMDVSKKNNFSVSYLTGGGEMGEMIRSFNWKSTSLGEPDSWPQSLLITLGILLNTHFAMILFWGDECLQFYNDAYSKSLGTGGRHPKALGSPGKDIWKERWPSINKRINHVITTGEPTWSENEEVPMQRNNQTEITYWTYSYGQVKNDKGQAQGALVVCNETTETIKNVRQVHELNDELATVNEELRAANEEMREVQTELIETNTKLAENEQKLRMANEAAGIGYWAVDAKTGAITLSSQYRTIFGIDSDNLVHPDELTELIPEPYREIVVKAGRLSITTGKPYDVEFPVNRKNDGSPRWVRSVGNGKFNEEGSLIAFSGIAMDITDQAQYRQKIEESEERFRTMAEGMHVMIGVRDENGSPVYFNTAWETLTGKSRQELLKNGWVYLMHPEDKERFLSNSMATFKSFIAFNGEFRILNKEGKYRWLMMNITPRFRSDGSCAGYISSGIDITEQKRDEERKNDFIGMVSHELKTPLTSLMGYIELVIYGLKNCDDTRNVNLLEKAIRQIGKMTKMINGFLNVSRLESGKLQIDKSGFDMAELIKEHEDEICSTIGSHEFTFHPVEETWVNADRDKIGHIIQNLVSNAVKYSKQGSMIQISCKTIDSAAVVTVSDEGMGIAQEDTERLFERYYRVKNQSTQAIAGFGIGLYLCAEIIQRHNGKIWVKSEPGKGAAFCFMLPVLEMIIDK